MEPCEARQGYNRVSKTWPVILILPYMGCVMLSAFLSLSGHVFSSLNNGIVTSVSKAAVWDDDTKLMKNLNLTLSLCVLGCRLSRARWNRVGHTPLGQPSEGLYSLHCLLKIKSASSCAE